MNKVNGKLTEPVRDQHGGGRHHSPPPHTALLQSRDKSYTLRSSEALRTPLRTSEGGGRAAQSASSASTRSISRRSATSIRLATSSLSKITMSFVISVTMSRAS
nr:MAG TPA: hypothetical protein [Caudoviricetes sp.]